MEFYLTIPQGANPVISGDKVRLKQIFDNLLSNAIKFTEQGVIELGYNFLDTSPPKLEFYVRDTGLGIPKDKQTIIFKRFAQVEDPMTRKYKGTGLGLSIVKKMVELMNGTIRLESTEGKGSNFIFTLPYHKAVAAKEAPVIKKREFHIAQIKADWKNKTLLIVDDFEQIFHFFEEALRKTGATLLYAHDGVEALEIYNHHADKIDLAFIDIQMPRMNGLDLAKAIREEGGKIPLIAQTGLALNIKEEDARKAGFDDLIYKPIQVGTLEKILKKYLK